MEAIVCDCCGKVSLLEDGGRSYPRDTYMLRGGSGDKELDIDLCEECVQRLVKAVKGQEG